MSEHLPSQPLLVADIRRAIAGDSDSWTRLYESYRPFLMSWAKRQNTSTDISHRDLVQEAWIRILAGLNKFDGSSDDVGLAASFFVWVRKVACHTFSNQLIARDAQKRKPKDQKVIFSEAPLVDTNMHTPSSIVAKNENERKAYEALLRLPDNLDRQIVEMAILEGHSLKAISEVLALEYTGVRRRYHQTLKQLQHDFECIVEPREEPEN